MENGHPRPLAGKPSNNLGKKTSLETKAKQKATREKNKDKYPPRKHTAEVKQKIREHALKRGLGGYVQGSGRGKKGWYKGHWCDSSYELAWIIYNLDHDIKFVRNTNRYPYEFEGKKRNWIPDFIMEDGSFVEIKGYETDQSRAKIASFSEKILLLKEKDLQNEFTYVINTYGKDYISLYERTG